MKQNGESEIAEMSLLPSYTKPPTTKAATGMIFICKFLLSVETTANRIFMLIIKAIYSIFENFLKSAFIRLLQKANPLPTVLLRQSTTTTRTTATKQKQLTSSQFWLLAVA